MIDSHNAKTRMSELKNWQLGANSQSIYKDFTLENFSACVQLIVRIAALAEAANHHPGLHLTAYRRLRVELSTHSAGGLTDKDFALAEKIDTL